MVEQKGKRVALVTGANRGLGLETARQLGKEGFRVVVTARDLARANAAVSALAAGGVVAEPVAMDVTAPATVAAAVREVERRFGRLDVLVNNAGIAGGSFDTPLSQVSADDIVTVFRTNTLGPVLVTQAFLPLLKAGRSPRIVNVSSGMGQLSTMDTLGAPYRISKTALNAVTKLFANELKDAGIKVNAVCPGWVKTDMGGPTADRSVEEGARGIVWAALLGDDGPTGGYFRDGKRLDW